MSGCESTSNPFFSFGAGEETAAPSAATAPEVQETAEETTVAPGEVTEADASPTPVPHYDDYAVGYRIEATVPGELQSLVASQGGCYANTQSLGNANTAPWAATYFVDNIGAEKIASLDGASCSYGWPLALSNGTVASLFSSSIQLNGTDQNQGVSVSNSQDSITHNLQEIGVYNPSAILEYGGMLLVLGSNAPAYTDKASSLVVIPDPENTNPASYLVAVLPVDNATALAMTEDHQTLVIGSANAVGLSIGMSQITRWIEGGVAPSATDYDDYELPISVYNGKVDVRGNQLLISGTGVASMDSHSGETTLFLGNGSYVSGAVYADTTEQVLFTTGQSLYLSTLGDQSPKLLDTLIANYGVGVQRFDAGAELCFCYGGADTTLAEDGSFESTVVMLCLE